MSSGADEIFAPSDPEQVRMAEEYVREQREARERASNQRRCGEKMANGKPCYALDLDATGKCPLHTGAPPEQWAPPIAFAEHEVPSFPSHVLPAWLREFVEAEAVATQTPVDLAAMLSLSVCAAALAKKVIVRACPGWDEPVNIYSATALVPASRKSAVYRDTTAPVVAWEREQADAFRPKVIAAEQRRRLDEKRLRQLEEQAVKVKDAGERDRLSLEAEELATKMATERPTVAPRVLADDVTPEKLTSLLQAHEGRIAVMSPEGGPFEMMAGRYSKDSNFDVYLKGHAGDEIRVDRTNRASEYVHRPALTVAMTVQPEVIRGLMARPEFRGKGLLARFLWTVPRSNIGRRAIDPPPVPASVAAEYARHVHAMLVFNPGRTADGDLRPVVLTLAPDGLAALRAFQAWLEPQLSEFGELGAIQDWAGKLCGVILRIVGILGINKQFLDHSHIYIDKQAVDNAITIGRYLLEHARAAFALMGADENTEKARHLLRCIERNEWSEFSVRDLYQKVKGDQRFKEVSALDRPLEILTERHYVRTADAGAKDGPGRPTRRYEVNPQNPQNPQNAAKAA